MLRLVWVVFVNLFHIIYYVPKMAYYGKHPEKYSEEVRYKLARKLFIRIQKSARVKTEYYGVENLPREEGGYILYSNHQGKYDTAGIIASHERPLAVLMDKKRSKLPVVDQFMDLMQSQRLDKSSLRQQIAVLKTIAKEVSEGRVYLIYPEGGYEKDQGNNMGEFKHGCFSCATRAKCTIVPVVVVDSYIPFSYNSIKKVTTKVIYLPPVRYEEYQDMSAAEVSEMVRGLIETELNKWVNSQDHR